MFGRPYPVPNHLGIIRLAFEVDDIDAAFHELRKVWKRVAGPPEEWDMGEFGTRKVVIFEDPDGIMLELHRATAVRDRDQPRHRDLSTRPAPPVGSGRRPGLDLAGS